MESPRKFNDCYFYYYSTCTKGDNCVFRHEPSALGCETMCSAWQQGKCLDKRCNLRHMELRKNRKQIPCYWENQPGGCRKKHCPFMHKNPDARTDGIAPSQPAPAQPQVSAGVCGPVEPVGVEATPLPVGGVGGVSGPAVPLLWQHQQHQHQHQHQQRQVVLDSAILGVLPASSDLLGGRRVVGGVGVGVGGVDAQYAPLPVDPLVVNFEEESDNESAPSSTPTKSADTSAASAASQELLLLERIQAEAAAFYSYDSLPPAATLPSLDIKDRKIVRTNLNAKYDRRSLDEIAGNKPVTTERRKSLDFKVLSLEEIRARKKAETIIQTTPITINLNRKRKLSTQETVTTSGNKIIKVVRSNSIVYKKLDPNAATNVAEPSKSDHKLVDNVERRKRTISELSDAYEIQADELVDNCYEFKRIKVTEHASKPRLIRNRHINLDKTSASTNKPETSKDNDSDTEVQIVSVEVADKTNVDLSDCDIIDVDTTKMGEPVDIVDLSDDDDDVLLTSGDINNVPDVVASCHKKIDDRCDGSEVLKDIDSILCDVDSILNDDSIIEEL